MAVEQLGLNARVVSDTIAVIYQTKWDILGGGIAFGAACLGIYILLIWETNSYVMPLLLMIATRATSFGSERCR